MSFETALIILAAFPPAVFAAYRLGARKGNKRTPAVGKRGASVDSDRYDVILENINAYAGDGSNQKEVEP